MVRPLAEWRKQVAPVLAVVQRPVDPALVVANPTVVLTADEVVGVRGVVGGVFLCLPTERTILIHANVPGTWL